MCAYNSAIIKFILKRVWKISNTSCLPLWIVNCHKYVSIICHRTLFAHTYDSWFRVGFCSFIHSSIHHVYVFYGVFCVANCNRMFYHAKNNIKRYIIYSIYCCIKGLHQKCTIKSIDSNSSWTFQVEERNCI